MKNEFQLPAHLAEHAKRYFNLLKPENISNRQDSLQISLSGYKDTVHLIGNIVKTSMLALGNTEYYDPARISEPEVHISGVLSLVLDLLPYEEAELLDDIRTTILQPAPAKITDPLDDDDIMLLSLSIFPPSTRWEDSEDYQYYHNIGCN